MTISTPDPQPRLLADSAVAKGEVPFSMAIHAGLEYINGGRVFNGNGRRRYSAAPALLGTEWKTLTGPTCPGSPGAGDE